MKTWRERLEGEITAADLKDASCWETCAVGEKHAALPEVVIYGDPIPEGGYQWRIGGPVDPALLDLGTDFYAALSRSARWQARELLDQIDDRVDQLKRERG